MLKKFRFLLALLVPLFASAVEVETLNAKGEFVKIDVPANPKRVAVADLSVLDTMDALGLGDRVKGLTKAQSVYYLEDYVKNKDIVNIGSVKEVDLEALMKSEPEIIFIGVRLAAEYDKLSKIAPVVQVGIDYKTSTFEGVKKNVKTIAKIFEVDVDVKFDEFEKRLKSINEKATGKTAIIAMVTSSNLNTLGNQKRCAMIGTDAGFTNLASEAKTTHGNDASFELVLKLDPEYIFVLDRDTAIGAGGEKLAKEVMDNPIINKTKASQSDKIFYLNPSVWYLSEGGITAMDLMLKDLESALER
ncbi:MAG: ABC transporter substrate-binding protein [Campylobacteraceae bacterium]|nr:ABC transporter substrate-binding protein [Campylobacteraceae bacterium]